MDIRLRIEKALSIIRNIGRASSTDGERIRILSATSPVSLAKSTSEQQQNASSDRLPGTILKPSPRNEKETENHHFAYRNASYQSAENGISASNASLSQNFVPVLNGRKGSGDVKISDEYTSRFDDGREINIKRVALDLFHAERKYGVTPSKSTSEKVKSSLKSKCSCSVSCLLQFITSVIPVLSWLPKYQMECLVPDIIAGFTISIMHIPQGMAYGILASLKPENGLYVSFFPSLVYFFFGTSRHISIGTFAVMSLLVSTAIANSEAVPSRDYNLTHTNYTSFATDTLFFPPTYIEIATSLSISAGFLQLIMGVFRLGSLSVVLSDQLVSGFSTGAAFIVAASQCVDLFGITIPKYNGPLKIIYMFRDLFGRLETTNVAALITSAVAIFSLAFVKEQINDRFKDKMIMPIPIELAVVVVATVVSYFLDFKNNYDVSIMGPIPTGLPHPTLPRLDLIADLIADSFSIAIVGYAISLSMAKLFAKKHHYSIRPSQELLALGFSNIVSSFFCCYPCSASLSRSLVQERSGCKTQVASVVSGCVLLLVLLVLAPMFYTLPRCILSAVIIVALKGMFLQVKDFFKAWKISKIDALIWLATFLSTVLLDVSYGLLVGIIFTITTVIIRTALPSKSLLGNVVGTDLYLDVKRFNDAREIRGIKILHFHSALYFMNTEYFKNTIYSCVPPSTREIDEETCFKNYGDRIHHIIIDCSSFSYVDMSGLDTLLEVFREYHEAGITVYLAGCSVPMCDMMERAKFYRNMPLETTIFPTVHDAVQYCNNAYQ